MYANTNLSQILAELSSYCENSQVSCHIANLTSQLLKHENMPKTPNDILSLNTTADTPTNTIDYDYQGAVIYIIFILVWYSTAVIILIKMQTKNSDLYYFENIYDTEEKNVHNVLRGIRERNVKRQALEDLRDPSFRQKMWGIYLENSNTFKVRRFETKRIQQIDRKLKEYYTNDTIKSNSAANSVTINNNLNNQLSSIGEGKRIMSSSTNRDGYKTLDFSQFPSGGHHHKTAVTGNNYFFLKDLNRKKNETQLPSPTTPTSIKTVIPPLPSSNSSSDFNRIVTGGLRREKQNRFKIEKINDLV